MHTHTCKSWCQKVEALPQHVAKEIRSMEALTHKHVQACMEKKKNILVVILRTLEKWLFRSLKIKWFHRSELLGKASEKEEA